MYGCAARQRLGRLCLGNSCRTGGRGTCSCQALHRRYETAAAAQRSALEAALPSVAQLLPRARMPLGFGFGIVAARRPLRAEAEHVQQRGVSASSALPSLRRLRPCRSWLPAAPGADPRPQWALAVLSHRSCIAYGRIRRLLHHLHDLPVLGAHSPARKYLQQLCGPQLSYPP